MNRKPAYRRLVKVVNGVPSLLAEDNVVYNPNKWYTVEARMAAGVIEISVGGTPIFQVADVSHASGKIGVYSWANLGARFDAIVVTTEGSGGCSYSVAPNQVSAQVSAGTGSIAVTAGAGCSWTGESSAEWVQITSGASGSGSGNVNYSFQANTGTKARQATLAIAGKDVHFTQTGAVAAGLAQGLFSDNFNDDLDENWDVVDDGQNAGPSKWKTDDGVLMQTTPIFGGGGSPLARPGTYLRTGGNTWTDYTVRVRLRNTQNFGAVGLMFGYTGPGNYYRFSMDSTSRQLVKFAGGTPSLMAANNAAMQRDRWYDVEARMVNAVVQILVDETPVFQANDATHDSGGIALYTVGTSGGEFDDVKVSSEGGSCPYNISPSQASVGAGASTGNVAVTAPAGCAWTSSSGTSWISITSGTSGSGNGTVTYSVEVNPGAQPREGTLTIAGETFTVTQQVAVGCSYMIFPGWSTVGPASATGSVTVTTQNTCAWNGVSNASWLNVSTSGGAGSGKLNYTVQANTSAGPRTATITIANQVFTLNQLGASGCQFELKPASVTLGHWATSVSSRITTAPGCDWQVSSTTPWITVMWPTTGEGPAKANFKVQANETSTQRQGSVSVGNAVIQITQLPAGTSGVFHVPPGASLQQALDLALPGDTITLQPGAVYVGSFRLRNKPGTDPITITTSDPGLLPPPGKRVTPAYSGSMPILSSPTQSPVFKTDAGASHYRLIGLEITSPAYNWDLIRLGSFGATSVEEQSEDFVLDRLYIHGDPVNGGKRGITLNAASTSITNCYISDIKGMGQDTQAILGWNGPGPYEIINNYLEAAGENLMFGGAVAKIPKLVPSDILIKGNHFYKQPSWRPGHPNYAGKLWTVKNILELKNARRVTIEGNVMEYNWLQAQAGYAIVFTPRTEGGRMKWAVVEDITFERNIVRHSGAGVNILGQDGDRGGIARRINFRNNLFYDINHTVWPGEGRLFQLLNAAEDVTVDHNTFVSSNVNMAMMFNGAPAKRFVYTNNLLPHGNAGVYGSGKGTGIPTLNHYAPGATFNKNVLVGAPAKADWYPAGNFFPASFLDVLFVNFDARDFRLSPLSPYKGAGTDGADIGANIQLVADATANAVNP